MKKINIAIIGATGLVGEEFINYLELLKDYINELYLYAKDNENARGYKFNNKIYLVDELKNISFNNLDVCFFLANDIISKKYIPIALNKKVLVIDNSYVYRLNKKVPLIIPEVNIKKINNNDYLIANPNCVVIPTLMVLNKLKEYKIKKLIINTMQSVSGSGKKGLTELENTLNGQKNELYNVNISKMIIPYIGEINNFGYCFEEEKIIGEIKKILNKKNLDILVNTNRVPIKYGHGISLVVEFKKDIDLFKIKGKIKDENIIIIDDFNNINIYSEKVYVSRLHLKKDNKKVLIMYIYSNNLKRGSAYNAYLILNHLIKTRKF